LKIVVHHAPVQQVLAANNFNTLVARAVAPLSKLLRWVEPHWDSFDRLLVIKGPAWVEERTDAREAGLDPRAVVARSAVSRREAGAARTAAAYGMRRSVVPQHRRMLQ